MKLKPPLATMGINRDLFVDLLNQSLGRYEKRGDFTLSENPERQRDTLFVRCFHWLERYVRDAGQGKSGPPCRGGEAMEAGLLPLARQLDFA